MKILITGASGFIGSRLIQRLIKSGYGDLRILTRNGGHFEYEFPLEVFQWSPNDSYIEHGALEGVNCVIHLAGEAVADGRWTVKKKERILSSRIKGTQLLMDTIEKSLSKPNKFISASAVGIYGDRGEEILDSNSQTGSGFLAEVCKEWEDACSKQNIVGMRAICLRIGIVLGPGGGALKKMLSPFRWGIAGIFGSGRQYMSWIHIDDLVEQLIFLIEKDSLHSVYNSVSPNPVTNFIFTKTLGRELKRPTLLSVPRFALEMIWGEKSQILLGSQKVIPTNFLMDGYQFKFSKLKDALRDVLRKERE